MCTYMPGNFSVRCSADVYLLIPLNADITATPKKAAAATHGQG